MRIAIYFILVSLLLLVQCSISEEKKGPIERHKLIGQWKALLGSDTVLLIFREDSSATVKYGRDSEAMHYTFSFERDSIINVCGFETMRIIELSDKTLSLRPPDKKLRESINVIYTVDFARTEE